MEPSPSATRRRPAGAVVASGPLVYVGGWLACVGVLLANAWSSIETTVDDAWISARYAQHLAEGLGLVYNAGEPAVEGYTNLLWVVLIAVAHAVGLPIHETMTWGGLACGALGLLAALALTARLAGRWHPAALVAPLALALSPHYAVAATNGLETGLFLLGLLTAIPSVLAARTPPERVGAGLLLGLLGLIRPEGLVVAALLVAFDLLRRRRELARPETWALALTTGGSQLATLAWRLVTYGALVPNTFHAKADLSLSRLLTVNTSYLGMDGPFWFVAGGLLLVGPALAPRTSERLVVALIGLTTVVIAFRVQLWMPAGRLLVPALALTLCNLAAAVAAGDERWRRVLGAGLVAVALLVAVSPVASGVRAYDARHSVLARNATARAGAHLAAHAPPGAWLAVRDAGVLAYHVGPGVKVAELHDRALTVPHPGGADLDLATVPPDPTFVALTQAREEASGIRYGNDRQVFHGLRAPYVYLGRVYQHHHRYYDLYARADAGIPPLPEELVVNRAGPRPSRRPPRRR